MKPATALYTLFWIAAAGSASSAPAVPPPAPSIERVADGLALNGINCALLPARSAEHLPNLGAVFGQTGGHLSDRAQVTTLNPFGAITEGGGASGLPPGSWQHTGVDIPVDPNQSSDIRTADHGVVVFSSLDIQKPPDLNCTQKSKPALCTFLARGGLVIIKHLASHDDSFKLPQYVCPGKDSKLICHEAVSTSEIATYYLHLHPGTIAVHTGDQVVAGELIGHTYTVSEKTQLALAYPPHLHLEVWRDCSRIDLNGYEAEGEAFRNAVGHPLLDPVFFERSQGGKSVDQPPEKGQGFAILRPAEARAFAPLTPPAGSHQEPLTTPQARTIAIELWRDTTASDFAFRQTGRTESGTWNTRVELTYRGKSFSPAVAVGENSPGVWVSWPEGSSRAAVVIWDTEGENRFSLLDIDTLRSTNIDLGFFPRDMYWSLDAHSVLLIGPTGEGRTAGSVNALTGEARSKSISFWDLRQLRWIDAHRIEFSGTRYDPDCAQLDPSGAVCVGRKNQRSFSVTEDVLQWTPLRR